MTDQAIQFYDFYSFPGGEGVSKVIHGQEGIELLR